MVMEVNFQNVFSVFFTSFAIVMENGRTIWYLFAYFVPDAVVVKYFFNVLNPIFCVYIALSL